MDESLPKGLALAKKMANCEMPIKRRSQPALDEQEEKMLKMSHHPLQDNVHSYIVAL
jgi:hypothetical protein